MTIRKDPSVHLDEMAIVDGGAISHDKADSLQKTGALCVAWEGAGCARAAAFNRLPFVEIRAISDSACDRAAQDFAANLEATMKRTASLLSKPWSQASA